jgi:hypothetical protein
MPFPSRSCKGINLSTGKPCRQPLAKGQEFCRFHLPQPTPGQAASESPSPPSPGGKKGNSNARSHGAYSPRLLPEELPLYEEKRAAFTAALGTVDVFDEQIVHLLALISVKVDAAMMKGADHATYGGMIKQILDLMKELKATRASKDPVDSGRNLTYADLFAELKAHFEKQDTGIPVPRKREERPCSRCRQQAAHEETRPGVWQCQNCGTLTGIPILQGEEDEQ